MLKKSTALEWLALCLEHCVMGAGATLTYRFLQTYDVHHWHDGFQHYFDTLHYLIKIKRMFLTQTFFRGFFEISKAKFKYLYFGVPKIAAILGLPSF